MTSDEALEDREPISIKAAGRELARHYCQIVGRQDRDGQPWRIMVTNDCDPAEWIDCTPAAIMAWLGY